MDATIYTDDGDMVEVDTEYLTYDDGTLSFEVDGTKLERVDSIDFEVHGPVQSESVYVVERHDGNYYGPQRSRLARDIQSALELVTEEMDQHGGEDWEQTDTGSVLRFTSESSGWIRVRERKIHD